MEELGENIYETPFEIRVDFDGNKHQITIIPGYKNQESDFLVLLDGIGLGELKFNPDTGWYWNDGNLTKDEAEIFGHEIEKRYK